MDSLFEYANAEYKVYTEVISCDDKELCVAQYIGNHEGDERSKMCIISWQLASRGSSEWLNLRQGNQESI